MSQGYIVVKRKTLEALLGCEDAHCKMCEESYGPCAMNLIKDLLTPTDLPHREHDEQGQPIPNR